MVLYVEHNHHMSFQLWVGDDTNSNGQYFQAKTTALEEILQDSMIMISKNIYLNITRIFINFTTTR